MYRGGMTQRFLEGLWWCLSAFVRSRPGFTTTFTHKIGPLPTKLVYSIGKSRFLDTCSVLNLFLVFVQITANLLSFVWTDWIVLLASGNTGYLTSWCPSWHWYCRHFSSPFVTPIDPQGEKRGFFVRPGAVSNYLEKKIKKLHIVEHIIVC